VKLCIVVGKCDSRDRSGGQSHQSTRAVPREADLQNSTESSGDSWKWAMKPVDVGFHFIFGLDPPWIRAPKCARVVHRGRVGQGNPRKKDEQGFLFEH
jgi:hypothetical protein